jgi:abortive infection bacteriophage resistance protein
VKPFKETSDLIALLAQRGLDVDRPDSAAFLHDFNYYRFTGYSRQFQQNPKAGDDAYAPGTTFSEICEVIEWDAELRRLLGAALTVVELSVRARFAHEAGRLFGENAFYLDDANYLAITPGLTHFIESMCSDLKRSKSPTVARYRQGDDDFSLVPIWVAVEVLSFGSIAKMMTYLADDSAARQVALSYSLAWVGFQSTIHAFAVLRNQCAHHGQIWNRKPNIVAPVPKKQRPREKYDHQGAYPGIIMLKIYIQRIRPGSTWPAQVDSHLNSGATLRDGILNPFAK